MSEITKGKILQSIERPRLRECPFCGGEATMIGRQAINIGSKAYSVKCESCGASTREYYASGEAEKAWNRRTK